MKIQDIKNFIFGTLRGRIILGVALIHAVMMTLFIMDLTFRQHSLLHERHAEEATAVAKSLATSAAVWIVSDDVAGLQELVESERIYPELLFAILTDEFGRVLAHTDKDKLGLYLMDLPNRVSDPVLLSSSELVDVIVPAMLANRHVGWARIGIGCKETGRKLAEITFMGAFYAVVAIVVGSIIAWWMGSRITRRLYSVQETISKVRVGNQSARSAITGSDEAASVAMEFNKLLDELEERNVELVKSEGKYRTLYEESFDGIFITSPQGKILDMNKKGIQMFGYDSKEEILRLDLERDVYAFPLDRKRILVMVNSQGTAEYEVVVKKKNGEHMITHCALTAVKDALGVISHYRGIIRDISEQKQAEKILKEQYSTLHSIIESTNALIFSIDQQYRYTSFNKGHAQIMKSLYGVDIEHGFCMMDYMTVPGDREVAKRNIDTALAGLELIDESYSGEELRSRKYFRVSHSPIKTEKEEVIGVVVLAQDITDRKLAEETLRINEKRLAEAQRIAKMGNWELDVVNNKLWWSDEAYRIFDLKSGNFDVTFEDFMNVVHPDDRERLQLSISQALQYKTGSWQIDYRIVHSDGTIRFVHEEAETLFDEDNKPLKRLGTVQDITDFKTMQEQTKHQQMQLIQAEKMASLGIIVAGVAHEINNPNNYIMLNAPLIRKIWEKVVPVIDKYCKENGDFSIDAMSYSALAPNIVPLMDAILQGSKRIQKIVNSLKEYSRQESFDIRQDVDLNQVVQSALILLESYCKKHTHEFKVELFAEPLIFNGSFQRIEQVIINLIQNACEALISTKQSVKIKTTLIPDKNSVFFIIEDQGKGIRPEELSKIFDPFYTTKRGSGGTGLGLSISLGIVKDHGGNLVFESSPGSGTKVTLELPAKN
ncbi:MAG: PAS/PAC sensor signal transduction histidine kinase [uncultured bacterium]|nr:MAG: PAS/PAC sensor signal transduction histidine kinase [uncultured bacterium]